jgi:Na+/H+ antiporter NhaD/arsenite permease-like protein
MENVSQLTFWVGTGIFILTYLAIAFDKKIGLSKTAIAMFGSSLMLVFILSGSHAAPEAASVEKSATVEAGEGHVAAIADTSEHAAENIDAYSKYADFNVIFLLAGMMMIVNVLRKTGIFQYLAIWSAKTARGHPLWVLILLVIVTATLSAFLDNVTTVLLIAPVTLLVAEQMGIKPVYLLIPEVLASNIGGTATLIGDPPNILIGSYASLDFLAFLQYLAPVVVVVMIIFVVALFMYFNGKMNVTNEQRARIMDMDERRAITDMALLKKTGVVLALTMLGFLLHGQLHIEAGVVAMAGAALMLVISKADIEKALEEVEWTTLFFFLGLFIVVSGAKQVGVIEQMANGLQPLMVDPYWAAILILWGAALCAGVMNNVSFTAAALPIVAGIIESLGLQGAQAAPLWWALALGACLGGNLTPVGAAANVIVFDIAERNGHAFSFSEFMKCSVPVSVMSLIVSTGYVLLLLKLAGL